MPSIAERLAALNQASTYKGGNEDKASVARAKPMNDRLATLGVAPGEAAAASAPQKQQLEVIGTAAYSCWVEKQGTGVMAAKFMSRWCEVYAQPPLLRFYTDAMATQYKGEFRRASRRASARARRVAVAATPRGIRPPPHPLTDICARHHHHLCPSQP
eukprot:1638634-Prymnesium_polylepis.1